MTERPHRPAEVDVAIIADGVVTMAGSEPWLPSRQQRCAVAIRDQRVVGIGEAADVPAWRPRQVLEVEGVVIPGFVDAHAHPVSVAHHQPEVSLAGLTTVAQVQAALRGEAAARPGSGWVFGTDLEPSAELSGRLDARMVDDAVGARPAYVRIYDGHSAIVSSAALKLCGIDGPRDLPAGARIVCDADGRPTGELREDPAMELTEPFWPPLSQDHIAGRLLEILDEMAACGLTCVNAMDDRGGQPWHVLRRAEAIRPLPVRVIVSPVCRPGITADGLQRLADLQGRHGAAWEVRGVKLYLDGGIDNGTGWLDGGDEFGTSLTSVWDDDPGGYADAIAFFDRNGIFTATHATGDAAVAHALDAIIAAQSSSPQPGPAHRIEHVETIAVDRLAQFAAHGVIASMQPSHSAQFVSADRSDAWSTHLGADRVEREGYRFRTLHASGARLAFSSDWPVASFDPRRTVAAAVLQHPVDAPDDALPAFADQRLDFGTAIACATRTAAQATNVPGLTGTVEVGCFADLAVWPTPCVEAVLAATGRGEDVRAARELAAGAPLLTMVGGRIAHTALGHPLLP